MIVVSNISPLVNLAIVGQLDLLRQLYGKIVIEIVTPNPVIRDT